MEIRTDEENRKPEVDSSVRTNEGENSYHSKPLDVNKCVVCEENAARTDLYMIWQNANFKGIAEISICKECMKPYLSRKTGKLFGAIFICILLLGIVILALSGEAEGFDFGWWHVLMMFGAAYQAFDWFLDYTKSGDVMTIGNDVLQDKMAYILGKTKIKEPVIINWEAFKEKQQSGEIAVTNFKDANFMASVTTPISLETSSGASRIALELIPETSELNNLPKYFNDEDKELLKESVNRFRQEKIDAHNAEINALQEKYLNKSN